MKSREYILQGQAGTFRARLAYYPTTNDFLVSFSKLGPLFWDSKIWIKTSSESDAKAKYAEYKKRVRESVKEK